MPQREFDITINPDGSVEVHVQGFKGRTCLEAIKAFEEMIGPLKHWSETSEFYEPGQDVQIRIDRHH